MLVVVLVACNDSNVKSESDSGGDDTGAVLVSTMVRILFEGRCEKNIYKVILILLKHYNLAWRILFRRLSHV